MTNQDLPLFELFIDPFSQDVVVNAVGLVKSPAIETDFLSFNKTFNEKFISNDEKFELIGPAMIPDMKIYRESYGLGYYVTFSKETIREIAQTYFKNGFQNNLNLNHDSSLPAHSYIFQSYIVDSTKDINPPKGIDVPDGSWIVGVKVTDKGVWDQIKSGEVKGFSIEGTFHSKQIFNQINQNKKIDNMNLKNELNKVVQNMKEILSTNFDKVYSYDEIKISNKDIGGVVEMVQSDGTLVPAPDGSYQMDDGFSFTTKGGMIDSIGDQPQPDQVSGQTQSSVEEMADTTNQVDQKISDLESRIKSLEDMISGLTQNMESEKQESLSAINQINEVVDSVKTYVKELTKVPVELSKVDNNPKVKEENENSIDVLASLFKK